MDIKNIIRTRFAPSPTGYMHIGNLRTALYAYLIAKSKGGQFILRIEDTDQERLVEGSVDVILKTLEMTGLKYDEGPNIGGPYGPYIQSERKSIYKQYAEKLVNCGCAYYCFCSQERLQKLHDKNGVGGYDRHCRNLNKMEVEEHLKLGDSYVIRQRIPLDGTTTYYDDVFGEVTVNNEDLQDQILLKGDGYPTYNFAHVIDDYLMGITHVVRGSEYLSSTPKYVLLYDAFGWKRPHYVHLPLLMGQNENGKVEKLSKRHGAVSFQDLVNDGFLPEAIVNYIALLGWCPKNTNQEIFTLSELENYFSIDAIGKSPAIFDYEKLKWFNSEYIKMMSETDFFDKIEPILRCICPKYVNIPKLAILLHTRIYTLNEVSRMVEFITNRLPLDNDMFINKKNKTTKELCLQILLDIKELLCRCDNWTNDNLFQLMKGYAGDIGIKYGAVMWAVRIAIARQIVTPGGASELMEVLGYDETLLRITEAIQELCTK